MDAPIATGAQHVIVLIDCHSDMFCGGSHTTSSRSSGDQERHHEQYDTRSPMHLALQLCQQLLQERIQDTVKLKVGKRNGVGVLLYDTNRIRRVVASPMIPTKMTTKKKTMTMMKMRIRAPLVMFTS